MSDKILKDFSKFIKEELNKKDIKFITPKYVPRKRTGISYNNSSDEIKIIIIDPINWYYNYLFVAKCLKITITNIQNFEY